MNTDNCLQADIAIVGGGIAGCMLAMSLAPVYSVVVIDKLPEPKERVGESLAPAARRILRKLDLLENIAQHTGSLYLSGPGTRSYWGSDTLHIADHLRNPDGFGWHLDRKAFETQLRQATQDRHISCLWGVRLINSCFENSRWQLHVKSVTNEQAYSIQAKFVADASGRLSVFAKQAGIGRTHFDKLVAHWAIMPNREASGMSTIAAAENGWWYTAPLPGNKRVMALHTDPDLDNQRAAKDAEWLIRAAAASPEMAAIITGLENDVDYRGVVAANSTRLNQVTGIQWAAVGDAAMSFDPLSSQGMFNAMAGAAQLADLLTAKDTISNSVQTTQTLAVYNQQMEHIWQRYLQHKNLFYTQEQRWSHAPFWKRRQEPALSIV